MFGCTAKLTSCTTCHSPLSTTRRVTVELSGIWGRGGEESLLEVGGGGSRPQHPHSNKARPSFTLNSPETNFNKSQIMGRDPGERTLAAQIQSWRCVRGAPAATQGLSESIRCRTCFFIIVLIYFLCFTEIANGFQTLSKGKAQGLNNK